jgi:hypothetical protein
MDEGLTAAEHGLLEQARALVPVLAKRGAATTAAHDVPPATIADFHPIGILGILQPRRLAGCSFGSRCSRVS